MIDVFSEERIHIAVSDKFANDNDFSHYLVSRNSFLELVRKTQNKIHSVSDIQYVRLVRWLNGDDRVKYELKDEDDEEEEQVNGNARTARFRILFDFPEEDTKDLTQINNILSKIPLSRIDVEKCSGHLEVYYDKYTQEPSIYRYGFAHLHLLCSIDRMAGDLHYWQIDVKIFPNGEVIDPKQFISLWEQAHLKHSHGQFSQITYDNRRIVVFIVFYHEKEPVQLKKL